MAWLEDTKAKIETKNCESEGRTNSSRLVNQLWPAGELNKAAN